MGNKGVRRATNVPPSKVHTWKSAHWKLGSQPPEQESVRVFLSLNEKSIHSLSYFLCASHEADHIAARLVRTSGVASQSRQPVGVDHSLAKYVLLTREYAACGLFGYFPCHLASSLAPLKPTYTGKRALHWQEKTLPQSLMKATTHPPRVATTRQGNQMKRTWT